MFDVNFCECGIVETCKFSIVIDSCFDLQVKELFFRKPETSQHVLLYHPKCNSSNRSSVIERMASKGKAALQRFRNVGLGRLSDAPSRRALKQFLSKWDKSADKDCNDFDEDDEIQMWRMLEYIYPFSNTEKEHIKTHGQLVHAVRHAETQVLDQLANSNFVEDDNDAGKSSTSSLDAQTIAEEETERYAAIIQKLQQHLEESKISADEGIRVITELERENEALEEELREYNDLTEATAHRLRDMAFAYERAVDSIKKQLQLPEDE